MTQTDIHEWYEGSTSFFNKNVKECYSPLLMIPQCNNSYFIPYNENGPTIHTNRSNTTTSGQPFVNSHMATTTSLMYSLSDTFREHQVDYDGFVDNLSSDPLLSSQRIHYDNRLSLCESVSHNKNCLNMKKSLSLHNTEGIDQTQHMNIYSDEFNVVHSDSFRVLNLNKMAQKQSQNTHNIGIQRPLVNHSHKQEPPLADNVIDNANINLEDGNRNNPINSMTTDSKCMPTHSRVVYRISNDGKYIHPINISYQRGKNNSYNENYLSKNSSEIENESIYTEKNSSSNHYTTNTANDVSSPRSISCTLRWIFLCMILVSFLCNFDHGVIPACLFDIGKDLNLSFIEQSLLGSLVYIGLIFGILCCGILFLKVEEKRVLIMGLIILIVSTLFFSFSESLILLYLARFFAGIAEAVPTVYIPVWVDEYCPLGSKSRWISYTQLASILGTVCGYFIGGILTQKNAVVSDFISKLSQGNYFMNNITSWHVPFILQSACLIPITIILWCMNNNLISTTTKHHYKSKHSKNKLSDNIDSDSNINTQLNKNDYTDLRNSTNLPYPNETDYFRNHRTFSSRASTFNFSFPNQGIINEDMTRKKKKNDFLRVLIKEIQFILNQPIYVLVTIALSNLYFIVTGIQFWIVQYLVNAFDVDKLSVITITTFTFLTSPTLGVYAGGLAFDYIGGYHDSSKLKIFTFITLISGGAFIFSILSIISTNIFNFSVCMWFSLFGGSFIVPISITIMMASVPPSLRSSSSALSQISFNLLGWAAGPLVSGVIMDTLKYLGYVAPIPLIWGVRFILLSSSLGVTCFLIATFKTYNSIKKNNYNQIKNNFKYTQCV